MKTGTLAGGNSASLVADDNDYLRVGSPQTGTRVPSWIGRFTGVSNDIRNLRITYKGKNSQICSQTISIWNWTTGTPVTTYRPPLR